MPALFNGRYALLKSAVDTKEIIEEITSRDTTKVWRSSCEIVSISQNADRIRQLIQYLPEIKEKTKGLAMGGAFAPNQRFIDFAIKAIEFYRHSAECSCILYTELETFDPNKELEKGNIKILDIERIEDKWVDFFVVECQKCKQNYKVIERDYHYTWWGWTKIK